MSDTTTGTQTELVAASLSEYAPRLEAFVRSRVPPADVDDVLQVAAMRSLENADSLSNAERVVPWLYRIHRNVAADITRSDSRRERLLSALQQGEAQDDEPATVGGDDMCRCSVSQARQLKPGAYGTILTMVDMGESSLADAARVLGISVTNAGVRLHRARKALKKQMLEHCGVTSFNECIDCRCVHDGCCAD